MNGEEPDTIRVWVEQIGGSWFGVAYDYGCIIATAVAETRGRVIAYVRSAIRAGVSSQIVSSVIDENAADFGRDAVRILAAIESGDESAKRFTLSEKYVPEGLRRVLYAASAIPVGYASSYGNIANASGAVARGVGRIMATNPLYPIVPCHRVVGSDYALVGYGGKQDGVALRAKLDRLRAEAREYFEEREIETAVGLLKVFPVEWVIHRAAENVDDSGLQMMLFE